ncbi:GH14092 [Drosophila grimshawi]|uniref:GH14092 n=1 Tax=Drosophila grimshawi TaxID=7222 RepID=B4JY36_DROGR|nr:GH14092 [Drosophila grimshawi]
MYVEQEGAVEEVLAEGEQQQQQEEQVEGHNDAANVALNFSNFAELCRLCAIHQGPRKLHIFEKEAEHRQLLYKLRTLLLANITKDDYLPKHICDVCLDRLEHLFEWRQICLRNEHLLRDYAASMRNVRATIDFQVSEWRGQVGGERGAEESALNWLLLLLLLISGLCDCHCQSYSLVSIPNCFSQLTTTKQLRDRERLSE